VDEFISTCVNYAYFCLCCSSYSNFDFFSQIWDESAGESLLQIQLLAALKTFVSSLGFQSPLSYHMLMPILQSGINVDSPDALNLLEDSVLVSSS
jgi:hypothetical protein